MKPRVIVLGLMGQIPFAGQTWLYLNYLLGLHALGIEAYYVEDDSAWPYDPVANSLVDDPSYAVNHIKTVMERYGLGDYWCYRAAYRQGECFGTSRPEELYRSANALLNVCGAAVLTEAHRQCPRLIYVETDPVTNQLELANGNRRTAEVLDQHDTIVTFGENYGAPDCGVPVNGHVYHKTRQPIHLPCWPVAAGGTRVRTLGNWKQTEKDIVYNGETYRWSKHHEFLKFVELPTRTRQPLELCVGIEDDADRQLFTRNGWQLSHPIPLSLNIWDYQEFIRQSRAEWTVAKDQNIRLRSGWFSERSACYLASGKPVVTQDTGFGNILPTGEGLFAFRTLEEASAAIETINTDYPRHCRAARAIAEEYFDARKVLAKFLKDVGL